MNIEKTWKSLSISGAVLTINGIILLTIMLAIGSDAFLVLELGVSVLVFRS